MKNDIKKSLRLWMMLAGIALSFALIFCVNTVKVSADDREYYDIGMNDSVGIAGDYKMNSYAYVRFCPKKTGAITFSVSADEDLIVPAKLMKQNTSGQYVSMVSGYDADSIGYYDHDGGETKATYAVKKGVKYALQVETYDEYILKSEFHKVAESGGKKKSSAKKLKKGKAQYGMFYMGKKQSRWYKYKVPKTKTVSIQFKGWGNGYLRYDILVKGMNKVSRSVYMNNWDFYTGKNDLRENNKAKLMKAKLRKGTTIYIRVYTAFKEENGYYMLKCK